MNNITIIGNLGRDMELRHTKNGKPVGNFTVGVSKKEKGSNDTVTTWFSVVYWGMSVEAGAPHLKRGARVIVAGELRQNRYIDRDGIEQKTTELHTFNVGVIPKDPDRVKSSSQQQQSNTDLDTGYNQEIENDLPF